MNKNILSLLVLLTSAFTLNASDMETFYSDVENERKFLLSQQKGMIKEVREQASALCNSQPAKSPENNPNQKIDCQCFSSQLNKLSDREIYYESVSAYLIFQKMVAAKRDEDVKEYMRLKEEKNNMQGFAERLQSVCKTS
ncbi:hypothetical protein FLL45_12135 [Aliikangiella marina]|uniref:Secreted protein n=1 Tax=Aliikangiella marina TaxID=1712262 RepID=A0A545T8S3_9GAMM|nr:hypothetical protein [Aliikangiella marina]TQV73616.1 hypothetical protein FLL45_12135 [Aliikangiella marina]